MSPKPSMQVQVDGRKYIFPDDTKSKKLDESTTYDLLRGDGFPCVDIATIRNDALYLIEVKDYDHPSTKEPMEEGLVKAITQKVYGSLSVLTLLKFSDDSNVSQAYANEMDFAKSALSCRDLIVVADIFTSACSRLKNPNRRRSQKIMPTGINIHQKLHAKFKKLGIHVQVHKNGQQAKGGIQPFWYSSRDSKTRNLHS